MSNEHIAQCRLCLEKGGAAAFAGLLQAGFQEEAICGESVRDFLLHGLKLAPRYVDECLRTIFLNGKPVDDIDQARIGDNVVICLSAALPGAAGICMRRNSPYAALRGDITFGRDEKDGAVKTSGRAMVTVKLFNQTLYDLGPDILARGAVVSWERLRLRLAEYVRRDKAIQAFFDGEPRDAADLAGRREAAPGELVGLVVEAR